MNWDAIGAVGELLGALGVMAILGYLAIQIRQNTRAIRTEVNQARADLAVSGAFVAAYSDEYRSGALVVEALADAFARLRADALSTVARGGYRVSRARDASG